MKPETLVSRLLALELAMGLVVLFLYGVSAPSLLLLDADEAVAARWTAAFVALTSIAVTFVGSRAKLSRMQYVVRALAVGSRGFEIEEIIELGRLPAFLTRLAAGSAAVLSVLTLLPPLHASRVDLGTQVALVLLALVAITAGALPLYVLSRNAVAQAMELVPPDKAREALAELERLGEPLYRTRGNLIAAVLVPLSFVALAIGLVSNAHVREAAIRFRVDTAIGLARAAADVMPGALPVSGRWDALAVAEAEGYVVRLRPGNAEYSAQRDRDGRIQVTVPITEGHAVLRFSALDRATVSPAVLGVGGLVILLALLVGSRLGQTLSSDLDAVATRLRSLGSEEARAGQADLATRPRFEAVAALVRAAEGVAERFRIFTTAQERAIEAREATLRLRGLLFASVSHDLKSPLNAILGFSAIVAAEPLTEGQAESIAVVERRARELLALIETILDAARVEAQKLQLHPTRQAVTPIVLAGIAKGNELGPMDAEDLEVDIADDLPEVSWDESRVAQAIAALVGHAKRLSPKGGVRLLVRRRDEKRVAVFVLDPSRKVPIADVARLLGSDDVAAAQVRMGGLALGLSLARALVELHGGRLTVERGGEGETVFRIVLPIAGPPTPA